MKTCSFVVAVAIMVGAPSLLLASGKQEATSGAGTGTIVTAPGTLPIVTKPVTLRYMIAQPPTLIDFSTNAYTVWMEKQTGVHLEFEAVPTANTAEKRGIVLASGDYPDVFCGMQITPAEELQYGMTDKRLLGLNALIEKYGVVTKQRFAEAPEMKQFATAMDGEIYSLPSYTTLEHVQVAQRLWINFAWLNKLGLKMPTTTEELYSVLKAFKTKDVNGNGKADEIPLMGVAGGNWHGLIDGFLTEPFIWYDGNSGTGSGALGQHMYSDKGTLKYIPIQPAYREALRYIHKLWSEGLVYSGSYTQTGDQARQLIENPGTEIVGSCTTGNFHSVTTIGGPRYRLYIYCPPIAGPDGKRNAHWDPYGGVRLGFFAISAKCKYPEVAIRWADYAYTDDASLRMRQGEKGVDWRDALPGEIGFHGAPAKIARITQGAGNQNKHWDNQGLWWEPATVRINTTVPKDLDLWSGLGMQKFLNDSAQPYLKSVPDKSIIVPPLRYTTEENNKISVAATEVTSAFNQAKIKFITGELSLDTDWDKYIADLDKRGLREWLSMAQKAYDRTMQQQKAK